MSVYFITGAGTDIGKTYVATRIVHGLRRDHRRVTALKPVASGVPAVKAVGFAQTDTARLLQAEGLEVTAETVEACSPWRFLEPLSPDMAAAAENRVLAFSTLTRWCEDKIAAAEDGAVVLIEGVGGVMSPLTPDATNLDLIKALKRPAILVTGTYLGALSHALTALETLKAHGAPVQALVLNESADSTVDFGATLATLRRFAPDVAIAPLRRGAPALELELT